MMVGDGRWKGTRVGMWAVFQVLMISVLALKQMRVGAGVTSRYMRGIEGSPDLPLESLLKKTDTPALAHIPTQVYVSLHGPNYMQVSWITKSSNADGTVSYGVSSGVYTATATGTSSSYSMKSYTSGSIHYTVIGPLLDDTTYYYQIGGSGPEFSCKTPPPPGPDVPILFAVVGDLGQTKHSASTLQHIQASGYDVMILPGDLSYADEDEPRWDSFGELISTTASTRPWMVTQGNHEIEVVSGIDDQFLAYNSRFQMPHAVSGSDSNLFYSFEVAGCHIMMLGSYTDYSQSSDQYQWLQKDLAKVDRSKTPWLIGVVHAPWYNSNDAHQGEGDAMLKSMEDILVQAKVDIMFSGHVHAYERLVRVYRGQPNDCGILYLNIGDGGNREGLAKTYESPQPVWSAFREASYGHGELSINGSTSAVWTWHRNSQDEDIISDTVQITSLSAPGQKC